MKFDSPIGKVELCITHLEKKMDDNLSAAMEAIGSLEDRVERNERDLPGILEGFWEDKMGAGLPIGLRPAPASSAELSREERYWRCWRSLRIWPLNGGSAKDLETFLLSKLGMTLQ